MSYLGRYVLDDNGEPVPCEDRAAWGEFFNDGARRIVGLTTLPDGTKISTVFLGLDHGFNTPLPVLWETMVFGGPLDQEEARYTSRADAIAGHEAMVKRVRQAAATP